MLRVWRVATVGVVSGLVLAGCGTSGEESVTEPSASAVAGDVSVVASVYPMEFLAGVLVGDAAEVVSLTPPGVEPHDVELTAQDVARVQSADVVLWVPGFQPAVDEAVSQNTTGKIIDVTEFVPEGTRREGDPHVWISPSTMLPVVKGVTSVLVGLPGLEASSDLVAENGLALVDELEAVDAAYTIGLSECAVTDVVVEHSAYGYLTDAYGLREVPLAGLVPEAEVSPARLAEVTDAAKAAGVTTVYAESATEAAEGGMPVLASEIGAEVGVLLPLEVAPPAGDYLTGLTDNLAALTAGQGCAG